MSRTAKASGSEIASVTANDPATMAGAAATRRIPSRSALDEEPIRQHLILQPHQPDERPLARRSRPGGAERRAVIRAIHVQQQHAARVHFDAYRARRAVRLEHLPAIAAIPGPARLLPILVGDLDLHGEHTVAVAPRHNHRMEGVPRALAREPVDPVIEYLRTAVDLVEVPRQVLAADLVGAGEKISRLGMFECIPLAVGLHPPLPLAPSPH